MTLAPARAVTSWDFERGRQTIFDRTDTGTGRIVLRNTDGAFDPTNAASPYTGDLLALKQTKINLQHPIAGTYHDLFTGYVEDWQIERRGRKISYATCNLVDGFDLLANAEIDPDGTQSGGGQFYAGQHVDDRIRAAAADAGWPAGRTTIFTGNVDVAAKTYGPGSNMLDVIEEAAEAEFPGVANVFISRAGWLTFHGRYARFNPTDPQYGINTWRLGDGPACAADPTLIPIHDLAIATSKVHLVNKALAYPAGSTDAAIAANFVKDQTSIDDYGPRGITLPDLITAAGTTSGLDALAETKAFGQWYVDNFAQPIVDATGLVVRGLSRTDAVGQAVWDFILNVEIGDIVELTTEHPGGGGLAAADFFVEGIQGEGKALNDPRGFPYAVKLTLDLSPRELYAVNPWA